MIGNTSPAQITRKEIAASGLFIVALILVNFWVSKNIIDFVCNPGAAFGIMLPTPLFAILWLFVMIIVVKTLMGTEKTDKLKYYGLFLILIGGLANIADRFIHGCVIDYIRIVPWNSFNIADACIFIGAVAVLCSMYKKEGR